MSICDESCGFNLVVFIPYGLVALGVFIAVFAKALRKCPFQPNEFKVFTRPTLPRTFSKIYIIGLNRPASSKSKLKAQL